MQKMKLCPYCGEEIEAKETKCPYCNEMQPKVQEDSSACTVCPICGEEVDAKNSFCPHCGERLNNEKVQHCEKNDCIKEDTTTTKTKENICTEEAKEEPGFFEYYFYDTFIKHYADFKGTIGRKQYWIGLLLLYGWFTFFIGLGAYTNSFLVILICIISFWGVIIPYIAIDIRRMHDCGLKGIGWILLFLLTPLKIWPMLSKGETKAIKVKWNKTDSIVAGVLVLLSVVCLAFSQNRSDNDEDLSSAAISSEDYMNNSFNATDERKEIVTVYKKDGHTYQYYLKGESGYYKNELYQYVTDENEEYTFSLENLRFGENQIMITSIADYRVKNEKIIIIGNNGACGQFAGQYVVFLDMNDKKLSFVDFGASAEFIDSNKLKVTKEILIKEGSCTAENEYAFKDIVYNL